MRSIIVTLGLLALATGCAGVPEQTFNQDRMQIRSIAVAQPVYHEELLLRYRNDQLETVDAISPVPVGRLFAFIAKERREAKFTEQAETASTLLATDLKKALDSELETLHFETVNSTPGPNQDLLRSRYQLLKKIPAESFGGADALLETAGQIGFVAAGRGKPYQPALWIIVRLTQRDGITLLQDRVVYNPVESNELGIMLYPTDTYRFDTRDELLNSTKASEALLAATNAVAKEIAFLLKSPVRDVD